MKLYDVCNDYSLSPATDLPANGAYRWITQEIIVKGESVKVELGYDRKYSELHYLRTDSDLKLEGVRVG